MDNLKILALGRNQIKKIENLDSVADTLEELWISYNILERLVSLLFCVLPYRQACTRAGSWNGDCLSHVHSLTYCMTIDWAGEDAVSESVPLLQQQNCLMGRGGAVG